MSSTAEERRAIEALGVVLPRDPSSIARRARPEAVSHVRLPLGLKPIIDDEPDADDGDDEDALPIDQPPLSRADNRTASLLDIDYLVRAALRQERQHTGALWRQAWGPAVGELMAEEDHAIRVEVQAAIAAERARTAKLEAQLNALRIEVAELRGASSGLARSGIIRP